MPKPMISRPSLTPVPNCIRIRRLTFQPQSLQMARGVHFRYDDGQQVSVARVSRGG
jgi:hypothetical protein